MLYTSKSWIHCLFCLRHCKRQLALGGLFENEHTHESAPKYKRNQCDVKTLDFWFPYCSKCFFLKSVALGFTLCGKMIAIERTLENQGFDLFLEQRVLYANHGSNKSRKSANCQTFLKKRKLPVIKLVNRNSIIK